MILIEAGQPNDRNFDAKLLLAAQLAERGHRIVIDEETLPEGADRSRRYDAVPFLADLREAPPTAVLLLGAEDIATDTLVRLRARALPDTVPVVALGHFPDHQAEIGARTKIAYALGREPALVNLGTVLGEPLPGAGPCPLTAPDRPLPAARADAGPLPLPARAMGG